MVTHNSTRVAVIGAGVAGAAAARTLRNAGITVDVFDKARGPGGRASTRREGDVRFDHGAQYFTVRDARFQKQVDAWIQRGVVAEWNARFVRITSGGVEPAKPSRRFVGVPGMNAMAADLLSEAPAHFRRAVEAIHRDRGGWTLTFAGGDAAAGYDRLIVTAPPQQAAALLRDSAPDLAARIDTVPMQPCWTVMLAFAESFDADFDAAFVGDAGPLAWIARNSAKPGRSGPERWVLHAGNDWSAARLEGAPDEVIDTLTRALATVVDSAPPRITLCRAHRWRYAFAAAPLGEPCLVDSERGVVVCGDWLLGPRIESAYLSGVAAGLKAVGANPSAKN